MIQKIFIENLGCAKNLVDSERILGLMLRNGYRQTHNPNDADIVLINTCSFILPSREESIEVIFDYIQLKNQNLKKIIVTGCLVETNANELRNELPEVDFIVNNRNLAEVLKILSLKEENINCYYLNREPVYNNGYSYIKISEGCNRSCSFCTIPLFKGKLKSRTIDSLMKESKNLVELGAKELVLVAQDTTDYGKDINIGIVDLLKQLITIENLKWIRLLYTYPTTITDELIRIIAENNNICSYIDVPLQHLDNKILSSMKRKGSREKYISLINRMRERIPDIAIRSTFIVGFPGETEKEFQVLYDTLKELKLDRVGVFTYSYEEDTYSSKLPNQVDEETKKDRQKLLMELQENISIEKLKKRVGKIYNVLIEEKIEAKGNEKPYYLGRSEYEAPEVDGNIIIAHRNLKIGEMYKVKITQSLEHDLFGEIVD